jgi:hypothetical protein
MNIFEKKMTYVICNVWGITHKDMEDNFIIKILIGYTSKEITEARRVPNLSAEKRKRLYMYFISFWQ